MLEIIIILFIYIYIYIYIYRYRNLIPSRPGIYDYQEGFEKGGGWEGGVELMAYADKMEIRTRLGTSFTEYLLLFSPIGFGVSKSFIVLKLASILRKKVDDYGVKIMVMLG
jgi:hypothetical protein